MVKSAENSLKTNRLLFLCSFFICGPLRGSVLLVMSDGCRSLKMTLNIMVVELGAPHLTLNFAEK
jgi:hypothetical protein